MPMKWQDILSEHRKRPSTSTLSRDLRSEFEKDYHRIIGSASFRRLQDKTQVFPLDKSDFIRTRLTHSLEVSSYAKSLGQSVGARILSERPDSGFTRQNQSDISDILQCAGLIHDIGNPPFGHFGEICIRQWFKDHLKEYSFMGQSLDKCLTDRMKADLMNFEGNAQALRLVTKLHFLIDDNGMNLTYGLLSAIIKYPCASTQIENAAPRSGHDSAYFTDHPGNISHKKMGYFLADEDIYNDIQTVTGLKGKRNPLTYLLEAADDIAYKTADIEDACKKGFISYNELVSELKEVPGPALNILNDQYQYGLLHQPEDPELYAVQNFIVRLQGLLLNVAADSFMKNYDEIMEGTYNNDLFHGTDCEDLMFLLGDMGWRYVFDSPFIYRQELRTAEIYDYLMSRYIKAVIWYDTPMWEEMRSPADYKLMSFVSDNYKKAYLTHSAGKSETERLYLRLLLITDYISGMTDGHATLFYQDIRGIKL